MLILFGGLRAQLSRVRQLSKNFGEYISLFLSKWLLPFVFRILFVKKLRWPLKSRSKAQRAFHVSANVSNRRVRRCQRTKNFLQPSTAISPVAPAFLPVRVPFPFCFSRFETLSSDLTQLSPAETLDDDAPKKRRSPFFRRRSRDGEERCRKTRRREVCGALQKCSAPIRNASERWKWRIFSATLCMQICGVKTPPLVLSFWYIRKTVAINRTRCFLLFRN